MEQKGGLFSFGDVKNHPRRSGFDLSQKKAFTAKAGELLPVYWDICLPGDKYSLSHQNFTRTRPVNTAAYVRLREYFDWFFVPLRQINKNLPQAIVGMQNNPVTAQSISSAKASIGDLLYAPLISSSALSTLDSIFDHYISSSASTSNISSITNVFGFNESANFMKLMLYIGYGSFLRRSPSEFLPYSLTTSQDYFNTLVCQNGLNVTLLPWFAYQKLYNDYFRNQLWENSEPWTFNADYYQGGNFLSSLNTSEATRKYLQNNNLFTLRYANWHKDLFMGCMPSSQLGSVATVSIGSESDTPAALAVRLMDADTGLLVPNSELVAAVETNTGNPVQLLTPDSVGPYPINMYATSSVSGNFNIIQLRLAEAVQRYREISQCQDQTYRDQIYAHWGVTLSPALSDQCIYIGGSSNSIDIGEVVNNNLQGDGEANIQGKGVGTGSSRESFTATEHGILMCIYHAAPLLDYVRTGPDLLLMETTVNDLPVPEFDNIGMESVPLLTLFNSRLTVSDRTIAPASILGYAPRYIAHKTKVDVVTGAFASTLKDWVAPIDAAYLNTWLVNSLDPVSGTTYISRPNYNWFKINPQLLNQIFNGDVDSTWDSDQFWINAFFDVKVARNLDYDGMPY